MRTTTTVTASAGQTTFSFTYNVGFLDVFINGTKLTDSEFTATNGSSVVLAVGCFVGDIVDLISYNTVSGGGGLVVVVSPFRMKVHLYQLMQQYLILLELVLLHLELVQPRRLPSMLALLIHLT